MCTCIDKNKKKVFDYSFAEHANAAIFIDMYR